MPAFFRGLWLAALAALAAQPAAAQTPANRDAAAAAGRAAAHAQDYEPRPAIWLLADEDTKIYLLGTVHMLPPGFRWRSPALERVVAEADELVVETTAAEGDSPEISALFLREDGPPLLERVPADKREEVTRLLADLELPPAALDPLQTWAAAVMVGMAALMRSYGVEDPLAAPGVEDVLEADFQRARKPVSSIEDAAAVTRSLNVVPERDQLALLLTGLEESDDAQLAQDNHDWARGEPEKLADILDDMPAGFRETLLTRRNAAWTDWLARRLERPGTVLVAVGAGHLAGGESVRKMLKARGLKAKRFD